MPPIALTQDWSRTRFVEPAKQTVPKNLRKQYRVDDIVRDYRSKLELLVDFNKVILPDDAVRLESPNFIFIPNAQLDHFLPATWLVGTNATSLAYDLKYLDAQFAPSEIAFPTTFIYGQSVVLPLDNYPTASIQWVCDRPSKQEQIFNELAAQWHNETGALSFIRQKAMHPAYQAIIGMGIQALPFIFRELAKNRGDWFWALEAITRLPKEQNPAKGMTKYPDARDAWLKWGRDNGYIA